ncbi:MAG: hypothetical protein H0W06_09185 [Chloroflexia bacterium]|nr:hypothetical protein [Chloroflexia bacterium]
MIRLQFLTAATLGRVLLTHNESDFLLHEAWRLWTATWGVVIDHAGVIVLPQHERWHPARSAQEIEVILAGSAALTNNLWLWRSSRGWFSPPIVSLSISEHCPGPS